jgi:hypothetical protein
LPKITAPAFLSLPVTAEVDRAVKFYANIRLCRFFDG